jgi:DNA repair exonuclease SbcCD ATPase subunit
MYIEFEKLSFCNILSYGAQGAEIKFQPGLNTIKAPNGSGKSTMLDALTFVLFGKPYRDIKLDELVNETNQKGLEVTIDFRIGNDRYSITRGLKPTILTISKNGKPMDLLSSKKLTQEEIDKLLGINLRLFKNIVAVACTNNKPFLSLPIGDKRALMENIFNIDRLGAMLKDVKKQKTASNAELNIKNTELSGINQQITDNNNYISQMEEYISTFNETRKANIERLNEQVKQYQTRINKAGKNITLAENKISELTESIKGKSVQDELEHVNIEIGKTMSTIEKNGTTLEKLKKTKLCPICKSPLDEGHAKKHLDELQQELDDMEKNKYPVLQQKYAELLKIQKEYNESVGFIREIKEKLNAEKNIKTQAETDLSKVEHSLQAEKDKTCPANLDKYKLKLEELQIRFDALKQDCDQLVEDMKLQNELIEILGDSGIKMYFYRKLIALLNKNVNEFLTKFELNNIHIEFDDQMKECITKNMRGRSYNSFSGGEKTRIDMSILLSFFNISRLISNWSSNLVFIDELLDQNIDKPGIDQFVCTLYNIIAEGKKNLGIYIISHMLGEMKVPVTSTVIIKKVHDFSSLEVKYG